MRSCCRRRSRRYDSSRSGPGGAHRPTGRSSLSCATLAEAPAIRARCGGRLRSASREGLSRHSADAADRSARRCMSHQPSGRLPRASPETRSPLPRRSRRGSMLQSSDKRLPAAQACGRLSLRHRSIDHTCVANMVCNLATRALSVNGLLSTSMPGASWLLNAEPA
jgi:hypothetical protein